MTRIEHLGAWPARILWIALAVVAGASIGDGLDGRSSAVVAVALTGLWAGWAGALVALLVPRTAALTASRILVPGGLAAVLAATVTGSAVDLLDVAAVALAALATLAVFSPWMAESWVDGSSYGPERRLPLRTPAALSYALVPVTWVAVAVGAISGPLLLAARQWAVGGLAMAAGAAVVWAGVRSLHQLSRRWVVLVPAGLVLHDRLAMPEAQLFPRRVIGGIGPAPVDTVADDLTAGAPGLALQLDLSEEVEILLRASRRTTTTRPTTAVLFTPSRPKRFLDAAAAHRLRVG
ncbi:hypothetical protein BH20ACT3_BH20ACT3_07400 [soil metagenome]